MFGFFKKQAKNKEFTEAANGPTNVEQVLTVESLNEDFSEDSCDEKEQLRCRVNCLVAQIAVKDSEADQLRNSVGELKRMLEFKTAGMERLQAEVQSSYIETDCARKTLHRIQDEMTTLRHENEDLKEKKNSSNKDDEEGSSEEEDEEEEEDEDDEEDEESSEEEDSQSREVKVERPLTRAALQKKVNELEEQLAKVTAERDELRATKESLEADREEEIKIVHEALEEALCEKEATKTRFERDFENLRTVNSDREQQMLDDFEWKLRQVEQTAKKKVDERAKEAERRLAETKADYEKKLAEQRVQLREMERLKGQEAELKQMRHLSHDQQRLLRESAREHECMQARESMLKDEIARLKAQLEKEKNILSAVQTLNSKRMEEREQIFEHRLENQRVEVKSECEQRLTNELGLKHREEMRETLARKGEEHERNLEVARQQAQAKLDAALKQVSMLKEQVSKKEEQFAIELDKAQVNADRDCMELRRKMDKLDMGYQDKLDALIEKHASEMEEAERRVSQAEMQAGSCRTTLELVKEQLARDADKKLQSLVDQHRDQLGRQRSELEEIHEEQLAALQSKHEAQLAALYNNNKEISKTKYNNGELEFDATLQETVNKLRKQDFIIADLNSTVREQDQALSILTQEKRALQLQISELSGISEASGIQIPIPSSQNFYAQQMFQQFVSKAPQLSPVLSEESEPSSPELRKSPEISRSSSPDLNKSGEMLEVSEHLSSEIQNSGDIAEISEYIVDIPENSEFQQNSGDIAEMSEYQYSGEIPEISEYTCKDLSKSDYNDSGYMPESSEQNIICKESEFEEIRIRNLERSRSQDDISNQEEILELSEQFSRASSQYPESKISEFSEKLSSRRTSNGSIESFDQLNDDEVGSENFQTPELTRKFVLPINREKSPRLALPRSVNELISNIETLRHSDSSQSGGEIVNQTINVDYLTIPESYSRSQSDCTNYLSLPSCSPSPDLSRNSSYQELSEMKDELLAIPATYFLTHTPDPVFPKEKIRLTRSKSLGLTEPSMHLCFVKSSSCPRFSFQN